MQPQLFLSGGGNAKQSRKFDRFFASKITGDKRVLYIPVAMPVRRHSYRGCFEWARKTLGGVALTNIEIFTSINNKSYADIRDYDAIYIGGGNTYGLLHRLRTSGFDSLLRKFLAEGKPIYGGSAGAIIFGRDINTASFGRDHDRNFLGMRNFRGLDLLGGYSVQAHYTKADKQAMDNYILRTAFPIIALPEETGLYVHGKMA